MKKIFLYSTILLIVLVFLFEFSGWTVLLPIQKALLAIMILSGLTFVKRFTLLFVAALLIVSYGIGFVYYIDFGQISDGIMNNKGIAVLFMSVPIISLPIRRGGYLEAIYIFFQRFLKSPNKFFLLISFILFSVGSVTNLASVRIVNDILEDSKMPVGFLAKSYAAGFAACMTWSPYFVGVSLAITYAGISFLEFFPYALGLALIAIILGLLLFSLHKKSVSETLAQMETIPQYENTDPDQTRKKLSTLLFNFFLLLILVIIGERVMNFSNVIYLVSFISLVYGCTWLYLLSCRDCFIEDIKNYRMKMLQTVNEVVFFLAVGILATAISLSPIRGILGDFFQNAAGMNTFLMIMMIILVVVISAMFGIHQIVSIAVLGSVLSPLSLGISPISFSLIFVSAWVLSALSSPFVPFNMVLSEVTGQNTFRIVFKHNFLFNICLLLVSGLYIYMLV